MAATEWPIRFRVDPVMPTPIAFTVTDAGRIAALDAYTNGLSITLETLRASTGKVTPDGSETALTGTLRGSWSLGGGEVNEVSATLRFFALVQSVTSITDIFSLGLFTDDDVLFAIASTTGADPLIVCHANIDFIPSFGITMPDVAASAITIVTDPNAPLAQVLMTQHQAASNPHPQYLRLDNLSSLNALYIEFLKKSFPIGTPYFNKTDSRDPAEILGFGTWSREQGRVLVGFQHSDADFGVAGQTGGAKTHTLSEAQLPVINPSMEFEAFSENSGGTTNDQGFVVGNLDTLIGTVTNTTAVQSFGGGEAHNNLQPYVVYHWWVRTA